MMILNYSNKNKDFVISMFVYINNVLQAQEKLKLQSKELKDALQQRKLAMAEYTEVTDK